MRDKSNELTAIAVLVERLTQDGGLNGTLVSIDAIDCNATISNTIKDAGADYLLAVKANQLNLRREIETFFKDAPPVSLDHFSDLDKGQSRTQLKDRCRFDTRFFVSSAAACAEVFAIAVRSHWLIENQLHGP